MNATAACRLTVTLLLVWVTGCTSAYAQDAAPADPGPSVPVQTSAADLVAGVAPSVVQVVAPGASASGVVVSGGVLTSSSAVQPAGDVQLVTVTGATLVAHVGRVDASRGLALLTTDTDAPLPVAELEPAAGQHVGDPVLALRHANPGDPNLAAVTGGNLKGIRVADDGLDVIQLDVPVESAYVGGPIISTRGAMIGLVLPVPDGTTFSVGIASEAVQAFLAGAPPLTIPTASPAPAPATPPPAPTLAPAVSNGPAYRATAASVALSPADLNEAGWSVLETRQNPPNAYSSGRLWQTLIRRSGPKVISLIAVQVEVFRDLQTAEAAWSDRREFIDGQPEPVCDAGWSWAVRADLGMLRCRQANVEISVFSPSLDLDRVALGPMVDRVKAGLSQS